MAWFSLKRTLQFDLASSISVINHTNQNVARSNLYTPLRSSTVLLSIGKITNFCHQKIPLKQICRDKTIIYISAIALKLAQNWQYPADEVASVLTSALQTQIPQPVWSSLRQVNHGWLEFEIAQGAVNRWQQQLEKAKLPKVASGALPPLKPDTLWKLQAGYELCCRWQACYRQSAALPIAGPVSPPMASFVISFPPLEPIVHCLLNICDLWEDAPNSQLLLQARNLVSAVENCASATRAAAPEAKAVAVWFRLAQTVLKQLLQERLDYPLASQF